MNVMSVGVLPTIFSRAAIAHIRGCLGISQRHCTEPLSRLYSKRMAKVVKKAVLFDLGGVVFKPPQNALRQYGEAIGLPGDFLVKVMIRGRPDNAFCKMERGELTSTQFSDEFLNECKALAKEEGQILPANFNTKTMFSAFMNIQVVPEMMNAITVLRENDIKTAAITNNYIDDREQNVIGAGGMAALSAFHFDHVIESCRFGQRKPDPSIFTEALNKLGVGAEEAVFLDDIGPNVKAARAMGFSTILVKDPEVALKELQDIVGVDVFQEAQPVSVDPKKVAHGYVTTRSGVRFHYVEVGSGPPVIFCHGFPESWYEWKRQLPAVALAGFRAIAMDMKGFGESSNPPEIAEYSMEKICKDMAEFLDAMCIPQATFIGHDWGGAFVWFFATHYADRVSAVAGLCTPFMPPNKKKNPMERLMKDPGVHDYQVYFQKPGVAEAEIESNLEKFVKVFIRSPKEYGAAWFRSSDVTKRGGILVGIPDDIPCSDIMTEDEIKYRVEQMKKSGLRGMLNWYRNIEENWRFNHKAIGRKLYMPALMVTCGQDAVLTPAMSQFMDPWVVNLTRGHIEESGHWVTSEKSKELNVILVDWLNKVHKGKNNPILPSNL